MDFDLENPFPPSMDKFPLLFHIEDDHMPSKTYLQSLNSQDSTLMIRREIVSFIFHFTRNFDPFLSYLAINYLDRFLSVHSMPEGKPWVSEVVAISCVSLALKMKKAKFSVSDLLNDGGFIQNSFTIERMEMLILGALNWRMRSVNPFSFANYFMSFFGFNDEPLIRALKDRAAEIVLNAQNDIKLLEFKPSVISASAILSATYELFPFELPYFRDAMYNCSYINKENLLHCYDIMQDAASEGYVPLVEMTSSLCTPSNVLDLHCLSYSISSSQINQMSRTTNSVGAIAGLTDQTIEDSQLIGASIERNLTDEQKTVGEVRERDPF